MPVSTNSDRFSPYLQDEEDCQPVEVVESKPVEVVEPKPVEVVEPKPVEVVESKPVKVVEPKPVKVVKPKPVKDKPEVDILKGFPSRQTSSLHFTTCLPCMSFTQYYPPSLFNFILMNFFFRSFFSYPYFINDIFFTVIR